MIGSSTTSVDYISFVNTSKALDILNWVWAIVLSTVKAMREPERQGEAICSCTYFYLKAERGDREAKELL